MWGYIVLKADEAADQAREDARSAGKSQTEQSEAAERAWQKDLAESKKITDAVMNPLKIVASWLDGN